MAHNPEFLKLVDEARAQIAECSIQELKNRLDRGDNFELIDVREESEFASGHIPGAKGVGRGILERDIEGLVPDKGREVVLYCGGGFRSALSAVNLKKMGYGRVASVWGGMRGWKEAGFPVQR